MNTTANPIIEQLENHIQAECRKIDPEQAFDDMLDECYSFKSVGGIFAGMSPSRVLRECDETAHRCGVNDYADSQGWLEIGNDYYDGNEVTKAYDEFVESLESELTDLQDKLEETPEDDIAELARINGLLHDKRADLEVVRKHAF